MGIFGSIFKTGGSKKRFDQSNPSTQKLWPTQIKKIVRRTRMRTVTREEKEAVIDAFRLEAKNGLTELECKRILKQLFFNKTISKPDYKMLISVFEQYYSGNKKI